MKKNNEIELDFKSFWISKENINKTNRQPSELEKLFANKATNKELISKIYKTAHAISKKQITQLKNGQI